MKTVKTVKYAHVHFGEEDTWVTLGDNSHRYDGSLRGTLRLFWDLWSLVFRTRKTIEWKFTSNE